MLELTRLSGLSRRQEMTAAFPGLDLRRRAPEGTCAWQENMSGEGYPALTVRRPRRVVRPLDRPAGCLCKDALAVVEGTKVVYNGAAVELGLSTANADCPKQLISMGAYLLIWPDKVYLNTADLSDHGSIDHRTSVQGITATLCTREGAELTVSAAGASAPESPAGGDWWLDTSGGQAALRQYDSQLALWTAATSTYVKLAAPNLGKGFSLYDGVTLSGCTGALAGLNGSHVLQAVGDHFAVIPGLLGVPEASCEGAVTLERRAPDMDFVTECDNRLWGCKYGLVDGKAVNEIYASKLGDFKNWRCYQGLSTDSYAAGRGADGPFTAAATHLGHPLFFREDSFERVYPSATGAHRIVTVQAPGVQKGSWRSLCAVGEVLYYLSPEGVQAYAGALPQSAGEALGPGPWRSGRAGAAAGIYALSVCDGAGAWHLFTCDTLRRRWHRQDGTRAMMFACQDGALRWIDEDTNLLMAADGGEEDEVVNWCAVSSVKGFDLAENEHVSRFVIRCETEGELALDLRYDDGPWEQAGSWQGRGLGSFTAPAPPRRCDHWQLRLRGAGPCRVHSVARIVSTGSDQHWRAEA